MACSRSSGPSAVQWQTTPFVRALNATHLAEQVPATRKQEAIECPLRSPAEQAQNGRRHTIGIHPEADVTNLPVCSQLPQPREHTIVWLQRCCHVIDLAVITIVIRIVDTEACQQRPLGLLFAQAKPKSPYTVSERNGCTSSSVVPNNHAILWRSRRAGRQRQGEILRLAYETACFCPDTRHRVAFRSPPRERKPEALLVDPG